MLLVGARIIMLCCKKKEFLKNEYYEEGKLILLSIVFHTTGLFLLPHPKLGIRIVTQLSEPQKGTRKFG
jgi:hypothetical protein